MELQSFLAPFLTRPLNVFHLQDSCGSGRVCRVAGVFFEDALPELLSVASVAIIHPDDAFDRAAPPPSLIPRVEISKDILRANGLLDDEGYVRRQTLIIDDRGEILATLPVADSADLPVHLSHAVLPALEGLI